MTYGSFAVLDRERNLPTVTGRKNRDFSIWDFGPSGGRFYTIFPYFHLAGFLSTVINPILTEASSPVLGPALMPPSAALMKEVMMHQRLRALYIPPSIAEQVLQEPNGLDLFRDLDFLCYTGGPFSQEAGEILAQVTELLPLYGSTEAFQVPQLAPQDPLKDYAYMEWNPIFKVEMQPSDDEAGAFELVLFADADTENMSALNHNFPGIHEWRTKDLFKRHPNPQKPNLWSYYGRRDDIVVLSNGEKFNPVPMELIIQGHPMLAGALAIGQGRHQAALIVEPKNHIIGKETLLNEVWPQVEQANAISPAQARIVRSKMLVASPEKPFARAGKGTIVRKLTEKAYATEIQALYSREADKAQLSTSRMPTLRPSFPLQSVSSFVREAVVLALPSAAALSGSDDLFAHGLDSLKCIDLCKTLKSGLQEISGSHDPSWITAQIIYEHPNVEKLSTILHEFVNTGKLPKGLSDHTNRAAELQAMVEKLTCSLPSQQLPLSDIPTSHLNVALTGSTGSLGIEILDRFIKDPHVSEIFCLDRSSNAQQRQEKALSERFATTEQDLKKIAYFAVDLAVPQLGLAVQDFEILVERVDIIVHNAWKIDFNQPLSSFESQIQGVRNLIDLSIRSRRKPRIMFVSSVASIMKWAMTVGKGFAPETVPSDACSTALETGYAESKYIAERVLYEANQRSGVPVSILRVGQIGGSTMQGDVAFARQEWLASLIETSMTMGAVPTNVSLIDWIPINELGSAILDIFHSENSSVEAKVFNLVNPNPLEWDALVEMLIEHFGMIAKPMPLVQWVEELRKSTTSTPAAKLLGFFGALGQGMQVRYRTENSAKASKTFRQMQPVSEGWVVVWLKQWGF